VSIFQTDQTVSDPVHDAALPIRFEWWAVEKIVRKHVRNPIQASCWDNWNPMFVASLRRQYDNTGLEYLAEVILEAAQQSLARPIVLFYVAGVSKIEGRVVLLANGAVFVMRGRSPARFRTCFFPGVACLTIRPEYRFGRVAMHYLEVYSEPADDGRPMIPSPSHAVFGKGDEHERRGEIRFVSAANWGFCQSVSGTAHSGRIPEWEPTPRSSP
jgi:hypothetical protein